MELSTLAPKLKGDLEAVPTQFGWVHPETAELLVSNRLVADVEDAVTISRPNAKQKGFQVISAIQDPLEELTMVVDLVLQWGPRHTNLTANEDIVLSIDFGDESALVEINVATFVASATTIQTYATSHTYAEEGEYTITATIHHSATESSVLTTGVLVEDLGGEVGEG